MGDAASFLLLPLALCLALGFLVLMGLPLILVAWLWWRVSKTRINLTVRVVVAAFICAIGIAPYVYAHGAIPFYILVLSGQPLSAHFGISFAVTFAILLSLFAFKARHYRGAAS